MAWFKKNKHELTYSADQVNSIVEQKISDAIADIISNSSSSNDIVAARRSMAARTGGYDAADELHNVYADYGYPVQLTFYNLWNMYRRYGVAKRGVELYPQIGWLEPPKILSSNSFLKDIEIIDDKFGLWRRLKGLDVRQRVGRYAGLFMRVRDGLSPDKPLDLKLSGVGSIVDMIPLYESQLVVLDTDTEIMSDDFGKPTMYQYSSSVVGSRDENSSSSFSIHPSRLIISAEGSDNGSIYGISSLEAPFNDLMDMRKVSGGGAEGFYKNAAQSIIFDLKESSSANRNPELMQDFNENYDDFDRNRARKAMWTPGLEAKVLDSEMISPKDAFMCAANGAASGFDMPVTILIGQQTGRLASQEDSKSMLAQTQSRKDNFQTGMVADVLNWMIKNGALPNDKFEVEWPDAMGLSDSEKIDVASRMASINESNFKAGGGTVYTEEEMREYTGYDNDMEIDSEEIPDDE